MGQLLPFSVKPIRIRASRLKNINPRKFTTFIIALCLTVSFSVPEVAKKKYFAVTRTRTLSSVWPHRWPSARISAIHPLCVRSHCQRIFFIGPGLPLFLFIFSTGNTPITAQILPRKCKTLFVALPTPLLALFRIARPPESAAFCIRQ